MRELIGRAERSRKGADDPKLAVVTNEVRSLVDGRAAPIVFCRFISTAHYVAEHLRGALDDSKVHVLCVTGELTSDEREKRITGLGEVADGVTPVLVATDCLSEGVNLQQYFNAVLHYDLTWNPTRHEQREGRVDRFGQSAHVVRAVMVYGEDNPVDGAVLDVIVRKAERIRRELGVAVPLPLDNTKVVEAIMKAVLLHGERKPSRTLQLGFDFAQTERDVDSAWQTARDRVTRTVFAQRRLRPDAVLSEWEKTCDALGSEADVERFVKASADRLAAPLESRKDHFRFPLRHLPAALQERLEATGFSGIAKLSFRQPPPTGASYMHRSHPLVATLAEYISEQSLDSDQPELGHAARRYLREK